MRKTTILSLIILMIYSMSYGQDSIQKMKNEFVFSLNTPVNFTSLSFGIGYKREVAKNKFIKINLPNLVYDEFSNESLYTNKIAGSLSVGFEFRKKFTSKLIFFHGPNIGFSYEYYKNNHKNDSYQNVIGNRIGGSISYTLGLQLKVNENIFLSAHISPGYQISELKSEYPNDYFSNSTQIGHSFYFENGVGAISFIYQF